MRGRVDSNKIKTTPRKMLSKKKRKKKKKSRWHIPSLFLQLPIAAVIVAGLILAFIFAVVTVITA